MKFLAILRDSLRETLDRKSFAFMVALSAFLILLCASISFVPLGEREAVNSIMRNFNLVSRTVDLGRVWAKRYEEVVFEVVEFRKDEVNGKPVFRIKIMAAPAPEANRLVRHWQAIRMGKCKAERDPVPESDVPVEGSRVQLAPASVLL